MKPATSEMMLASLAEKVRQLEVQAAQRNFDRQRMARFLAVCTQKAGGKIVLTQDELNAFPTGAALTSSVDLDEGSITFGWKPSGDHEY